MQVNKNELERERDPEKILDVWRYFAEVLLCQVVVFNRKRPGEISEMRVEDYKMVTHGGHIQDGAQ